MGSSFVEMLLFQVKPDKVVEFEAAIEAIKAEQANQVGCIDIRYFKRFYMFDGVEHGNPPRELTKIQSC